MARELIVRGLEQDAQRSEPTEFEALYGADLRYRVEQRVTTSASARQQTRSIAVTGDDADVIEIEDADGIITFHTVRSLRAAGATRGGEAPLDLTDIADLAALDLRGAGAGGGALRGAGTSVRSPIVEVRRSSISLPASIASAVATLNGSLPDTDLFGRLAEVVLEPAARVAMKRIADWIDQPVADEAPEDERRRRPKVPGLYRVDERLLLSRDQRLDDTEETADAPYLLLVHGTFSHTEAAFGALRGTAEWRRLVSTYGDRILALEHPTLGVSPAQNALSATELLPVGARLHIVSHSRGGLIGDVLGLAAAGPPDVRAYERAAKRANGVEHPDLAVLAALRDKLVERGITVTRFARVACPGSGTTLASRRLDRYATYLFNVLRLVPGVRDLGVAAVVEKLLLTLLDQRSDPRIVPGLEAQMPESPFIAMLNTAAPITDGLGAIVGDIEGTGILKRLKVLGADLFFREDHDLVVNTSAMSAGVPRTDPRHILFRGGDVSHTAYFANAASRTAVLDWITATSNDVRGFSSPEHRLAGTSRSIGDSERRAASSGVVVVVPDLMGSGLVDDVDGGLVEVWPNVSGVAGAGVDHLGAQPGRAQRGDGRRARGELVGSYQTLLDRLRLTHEVEPFVYDWRGTLDDVARSLTRSLAAAARTAKGRPVHVVTHGAGALVLLAAAAQPGAWEQVDRLGGRVVMLSPPLTGTWNAVLRRTGLDRLCAGLSLIAGGASATDVGAVFAGLPSLAQLLPDGYAAADAPGAGVVSDPAAWRRAVLRPDWTRWAAVYGRALMTPAGPDAQGVMTATTAGDGHVTYLSRLKSGPAEWFAQVPHHALVSDPGTIAGIIDLLSGADSSDLPQGLSSEPPVSRAEIFPLPDQAGGLHFPTAHDLVWMSMGASVPAEPRAEGELRVVVVHGSLEAVEPPVIVGTLDGTPIGGSELALDHRLGGTIARHRQLNQYPGPLGTCQLFVRPGVVGPDAAVIGMGDAGDLTPSRLTAGITQSVLRLCAAHRDASVGATPGDPAGAAPAEIAVASVLIGTLGIAPLTVDTAVASIVAGVRRANRRLHDLAQQVAVVELQIVELYEERATDALRAALRLAGAGRSGGGGGGEYGGTEAPLVVEPLLADGRGGRPGTPRSEYHSEQWRTVRVSGVPSRSDDDDLVELNFTVIGRAARAEAVVTTGQRRLIDRIVEQSITNPNVDRQIYNTLYELLVPLSLKGQGKTTDHLMYILDEHAVRLPLEMLASRSYEDGDITPLAVEAGLVRRLETAAFRERVRPATGAKALVIGDPPTTRYQRLPGAIVEARAVADFLGQHGYDVVRHIPRDVSDFDSVDEVSIMNSLFAHDYRIVHIAGHGALNEHNPSMSGVLIGDDIRLTASEIQQMQTTPDLVFLNCCHLGSMQRVAPAGPDEPEPPWRPDRFAAGIARRLIDNGVRAVIAAGWAVDDQRARAFAETLYAHLLAGRDLGRSTLAARQEIWDRNSSDNTWGAYQVYGPPAFLLGVRNTGTGESEAPLSRRELREAISRLGIEAADADDLEAEAVGRRLQELVANAPERWLDGDEWQRIGDVYRLLGANTQAEYYFDKSVQQWGAGASLRAVEALVNVLAKGGAALARDGHTAKARQKFERAEVLLSGLESIVAGESAMLAGMRAAYHKHRLTSTQGEELTHHLRLAHEDYALAAIGYEGHNVAGHVYTTLNEIVTGWLLGLRTRRTVLEPDAVDRARACREVAQRARWAEAFERLGVPDSLLVEALVTGTLHEKRELVVRGYEDVFAAGTSRRERLTVAEHLAVIEAAIPVSGPRSRMAQVRDDVGEVRSRISLWTPA